MLAVLDARDLAEPDIGLVGALARLALVARRDGRALVLEGACDELRELLGWCGLSEAVPCSVGGTER